MRMKLPPDEMAFRKIYRDLLEKGSITTVFRPEPRRCDDERGYCEGQRVKARILDVPGSDAHGIPPSFIEFEQLIEIQSVSVKAFCSLGEADFYGSSPDVVDVNSLKYHLGLIYNLDPNDLQDNSLITRISFTYVDE